MSVHLTHWPMSSPGAGSWLVLVIFIAVISWKPMTEAIGTHADIAALLALSTGCCGTAGKYSSYPVQ